MQSATYFSHTERVFQIPQYFQIKKIATFFLIICKNIALILKYLSRIYYAENEEIS